jgi:YHS domain-containing protein
MTRRFFLLSLCQIALVAAASVGYAQQPAETPLRLALKGYDPVAYFTAGHPEPGRPELETIFDGARYRFASADNMGRFKSDPDKYIPQFGGICAYGLSKGVKLEADPTAWRIIDGKLYVFAAAKVLPEVDVNPAGLVAKADANRKGVLR